MTMGNTSVVDAARQIAHADLVGNYDGVDQLEDVVAGEQASDMKGALTQVMLAVADARTMAAEVGDDGREIADALIGRIERCLYSAAAVMSREAGVEVGELGGDYWMSAWANPWVMARVA